VDVFLRASNLLQSSKGGKFTNQDDKLILEEVERSGNKPSTWRELSLKLNRDPRRWQSVRTHYLHSMKLQGQATGKFSLQEDQMIIEKLFSGKDCSLETVRQSKISYKEGIPEVNRSGKNVHRRWKSVIKPILISHHLGILHSNWKLNFLKHVVEKAVNYEKEIDWSEACKLFPAQNVASLSAVLSSYGRSKKVPLYQAIKENIYKRKHGNDYSEKEKLYRENIVKIYVEACKH
jgi:hypothetical protein